MALPTTSKKVFTTLDFQSGATLHRSKLHQLTTTEIGNLTTPVAGELAYGGDTHLKLYDGSNWQDIHRTGVALSTGNQFTVSVATGTAPFAITSTTKVANLNVDKLDGRTWDENKTADTIVGRDGQGRIKVGTPASGDSDDYAATKGYVDSVAQGLTIIDPCYLATTAALPNHSYNNGTNGVGATMTASANGALSIDGNAVSNGKRILVKDQANNAHNGIYTVTNAGSGSAAFVLTRATDYDEQGELLDGDFVFVQEGTVNANRGFVQTSNFWTATTGTVGTHSITWTQFSGAGQITVTSTKGSNSSTGPLIKTGDTIDFGFNATNFDIDSDSNLRIAAGGIGDTRLADNAVTPAKLDDDGVFTMGGLTVNGDTNIVGASTTRPNLKLATTSAVTDGAEVGSINGYSASQFVASIKFDKTDSSNGAIRFRQKVGGTNTNVGFISGGKLGIGADASSPSGTLHVSTARYGSDVISGWNFSNWGKISTNVTINSSTSVTTTAASDWWRKDGFLVVGRKYKIQLVGTKSANVDFYIRNHGGSAMSGASTITGTSFDSTQTITADSTGIMLQVGGAATFTFTKIEIVEDSLASTPSTTADDLVVNNGLTQAGMTLLGSGGARVHFGESGNSAHSRIIATYDSSKDSTLVFSASDNATAGTVMTLFGNDKSAKFAGGVGVGTTETAAGTITAKADGGRIKLESNDYIIAALSRQGTSGSSLDQGSLALYNAGVGKIELLSNGTSYFNGGNVAIGGTTADSKLQLDYGSNPSSSVDVLKIGSTSGSGYDEEFRLKFYSGTASLGYIGGSHKDDGASGASQGYLTFGTRTGSAVTERLRIDHDGTQNHQSNSIVNSATVAGLQDGACYDFNDTDSYIELASSGIGIFDKQAFTISTWVKLSSSRANDSIIFSYDQTSHATPYYASHIRVGNDGRVYFFWNNGSAYQDVSTSAGAMADDTWHHIVVAYKSGSQKIYVDGVQQASSTNTDTISYYAQEVWIGKGNYSAGNLDGSVRDFKYIPSWLDAGDVRKLYGGENPKKNNNVELISNGTFDSNITGWTDQSGSGSSVAWQNDGTVLFTGAAAWARLQYYHNALEQNKTYHLRYEVKVVASGGAGKVRVGTSSLGTDIYDTSSAGHTSTGFKDHFFNTGGNTQVYISIQDGYNNLKIDNVTLREVGTLVDMTPQSASSTQWRNEAMANDGGLYNGTVNNATLSQGNSYWNNIKQDATDTTVSGELTVVPTASEKGLTIGDGTKGEVPLIFKGGSGSFSIGQNGTNFFISETSTGNLDSGVRLSTTNSGNDIKIHNKLGVGATADASHHLLVGGTARIEYAGGAASGLAIVGSSNRSKIAIVDNDTTAYVIAENDYISVGGNDSLNAANLNIHKTSGNVAIGTTSPANLLHVSGADESMIMLQANTGSTGDKCHIGFGCSTVMLSGTNIGARLTFERRGASTGGDLAFHTRPVGGTLTERFVLRDDGTHDHKANRIVNSQTVNDSWRSSEPSLRFDNTATTNKVDVSGTLDLGYGDFTLVQWLKTEKHPSSSNANYSIFTSTSASNGRVWIQQTGANSDTPSVVVYLRNSSGATVGSLTVSGKWQHGVWKHLALTCVRSGTGVGMKLYFDGVEVKANTTDTSAVNIKNTGSAVFRIGNHSNTYQYGGEIKHTSVHNRALDADEIQRVYNGESTAFSDTNANTSNHLANGTFAEQFSSPNLPASWSKGGNVTITHSSESYDATGSVILEGGGAVGSTSGNWFFHNAGTAVFANHKRHKATVTFKRKTGNDVLQVALNYYRIGQTTESAVGNSGSGTTVFYNSSDGMGGNFAGSEFVSERLVSLGSSWFRYEVEFIAGGSVAATNQYLVLGTASDGDEFYIDNVTLQTVGEVAAYTPKSIDDNLNRWFDTTSNHNNGTISGATIVGTNNHFGKFVVRGGSEYTWNNSNSTISETDAIENAAGTIQIGGTETTGGRLDYTPTSTTVLSLDNTYNSANAKTQFGMRSAGTRLTCLEIGGDKSVTATSATSTNLKQVARGFTTTIIQPTGKAFTSFRLNHALGTQFIHVSVIESGGNQEVVECAVRIGSWTEGQTGANISSAGTGVTGVTTMGTENTNAANKEEYCMVTFATAPAVGTNYKVVVIGI